LDIIFTTQSGFSYQLQSAPNISDAVINWMDEGSPVPGSGGAATSTVPTSVGLKFFRVKAQ
jgi:hypothetical protein